MRLTSDPVRRPPATRLRPGLADRTDAQLLRLARDGDPIAYEAIVARYREPLRRSCARIVPDRAEDAVQQALLSAWMALERGADVRELRPWLYSIARNAAIDQARGNRSELVELGPEVAGGEDPAHAEARRREVTEVLEAVAALPDRQRRALVDTALHGRATEAVAVDLGLSGGALRQLVHRARTTVRAAVPSLAFPIPAWLAELLGEEGARRGAVLLSSGSGAAILAKATATVATVGAVVVGSVHVDHAVERRPTTTSTATKASATSAANASGVPSLGAGAPALIAEVSLLRRGSPAAATPGGDSAQAQPDSSRGSSSHVAVGPGTSHSAHSGSERGGRGGRHDASHPLEATAPTSGSRDERHSDGDHRSGGDSGRRDRDGAPQTSSDATSAEERPTDDAPRRPSRRDRRGSGSGSGRDASGSESDRGSGPGTSDQSGPSSGGGAETPSSENTRGSRDSGGAGGSDGPETTSGPAPATSTDDRSETAERDNSRSAPSQQ